LDRVVLVDSLEDARRVVAAFPDLRAVTGEGDLLGSSWACGGAGDAPSMLEVRAALEDAEKSCADLAHRGDRLRFALSAAAQDAQQAHDDVDDALAALHESDARLAAVAERLGQLGTGARAAVEEADRLQRGVQEAMTARDRDLEGLAELEERLAAAQAAPAESDPDPAERDRFAAEVTTARAAEVEARLAVRTGEERTHA